MAALRVMLVTMALTVGSIPAVSAAVFQDPVGDFDGPDVVSIDTRIEGRSAIFTISYAEEAIGMGWGVGGTIHIDSDQNPATGQEGAPGFEAQITFNVSELVALGQVDVFAGPGEGRQLQVSADAGNGTNLRFNPRQLEITVPLDILSARGDFDYLLYSTSIFGSTDSRDRVPDAGVVRASTGQAVNAGAPAAEGAAERVLEWPAAGRQPHLVRRVTTAIRGNSAVWKVEFTRDLPVGMADYYNTVYMSILLDIDRSLATGIDTANVPLLPFGPDRNLQCTLMGGSASVSFVRGIGQFGERLTGGVAPGGSDLRVTFDRRTATVEAPLALLQLNGPAFDWMLSVWTTGQPVECFLETAIAFDTGEPRRSVPFPAQASLVPDNPDDARALVVSAPGVPSIVVDQPNAIPNMEMLELQAALTGEYLFARVRYNRPVVPQAEYFTSLFIDVPGPPARSYAMSMNWDINLGGQAILFEVGPNAADTGVHLNQCLAAQGSDAWVLLPLEILGRPAARAVTLRAETREMRFGSSGAPKQFSTYPGITIRMPPRAAESYCDRIPDKGTIDLQAQ
ncbi:MAG: hypothetical protein HPY44_19835 [Armatimonadetes bacterium]|nr:hypothetical protein [Armatimonadota bacterium]